MDFVNKLVEIVRKPFFIKMFKKKKIKKSSCDKDLVLPDEGLFLPEVGGPGPLST